MKLRRFVIVMFFCLASGVAMAQVRTIKFSTLDSLFHQLNDTTYVVNFWATWCKPCVAELPNFEKLNADYSDKKVKVILVSMDFKKDMDDRLKPFVLQHNMKSQVMLLDDPDYNSWINKIDSSWSGGIPATIVVKNNKRTFYEHDFESYEALEKILIN